MKKTFWLALLALLLSATPALAQMGPGPHMMQQQQLTGQQPYNPPCSMQPGMMGGYGYGMPHMMGGYGYGPQTMGGYGYPMMPSMMMGGYGHHPMHHMGAWGAPPCTQVPKYMDREEFAKFMDSTRDDRRKMHNMMFDYGEEMHSQNPDRQKLQNIEKEIYELREKIFSRKIQ